MRSAVWKYFDKNLTENIVTCKICNNKFKYSKNTSNLRDHLKRKHHDVYEQLGIKRNADEVDHDHYDHGPSKEKQKSEVYTEKSTKVNKLTQFMERNKVYENNSLRKKTLDNAVALMLATDLEPYSFVERKGFQNLVFKLDPKYMIPSKTNLKEKIFSNLYESYKEKLKSILEEIPYVAVTTDLWTSINAESYIGVTCHFIKNSKLYSAILEVEQIKGSHTSELISNVLLEILTKWNVYKKTVCVVTDNAANITKAVNDIHLRNMPCVAHTLNLLCEDCFKLEEVSEILTKCKNIVTFFKQSTKAYDKLKDLQKIENKSEDYLKLIQSCPTRWNSTYDMIKRIIQLKNYIIIALTSFPKAPPFLHCEEIEFLNDFVLAFEIFKKATEEFSGDKYVTSSIIPVIKGIHLNIKSIEDEKKMESLLGEKLITTMKNSVAERLNKYEARTSAILSTLIDPRFKKIGFRLESNAKNAENALMEETKLVKLEQKRSKNNDVTVSETVQSDDVQQHKRKESVLSYLDKAKQHLIQTRALTVVDELIEIRQYLEMPPKKNEENPLVFWNDHKKTFPTIYEVAIKYLCIPATSVPSERLFSAAGLFITKQRNCLKDKQVRKLIFVRKNQWLNDF